MPRRAARQVAPTAEPPRVTKGVTLNRAQGPTDLVSRHGLRRNRISRGLRCGLAIPFRGRGRFLSGAERKIRRNRWLKRDLTLQDRNTVTRNRREYTIGVSPAPNLKMAFATHFDPLDGPEFKFIVASEREKQSAQCRIRAAGCGILPRSRQGSEHPAADLVAVPCVGKDRKALADLVDFIRGCAHVRVPRKRHFCSAIEDADPSVTIWLPGRHDKGCLGVVQLNCQTLHFFVSEALS